MLTSSLSSSQKTEKEQTLLRTLLSARLRSRRARPAGPAVAVAVGAGGGQVQLLFRELDGAVEANRDERDGLFAVSGRRGVYPQVFIERVVNDVVDRSAGLSLPPTTATTATTTAAAATAVRGVPQQLQVCFVGDYDTVQGLVENESIPSDILAANPTIPTFSTTFAACLGGEGGGRGGGGEEVSMAVVAPTPVPAMGIDCSAPCLAAPPGGSGCNGGGGGGGIGVGSNRDSNSSSNIINDGDGGGYGDSDNDIVGLDLIAKRDLSGLKTLLLERRSASRISESGSSSFGGGSGISGGSSSTASASASASALASLALQRAIVSLVYAPDFSREAVFESAHPYEPFVSDQVRYGYHILKQNSNQHLWCNLLKHP